MSELLRTESVSKVYSMGEGALKALDNVSLSIHRGEFVAIMGASGSGKSTFMNILGCLDVPSSGQYWLAEEAVSGLSGDELAGLRNRRIGFVFQQFNLLARTSALDNVALPLMYAKVPTAQRQARAAHCLRLVGLGERLDHTPAQLSGGQQQRVAIARALVNEPDLILADEPTGALDSKTSVDIMVLLRQLHSQGMTVVMVTHEPDIAAYAERVVTFKDGRIVEDKFQTPLALEGAA